MLIASIAAASWLTIVGGTFALLSTAKRADRDLGYEPLLTVDELLDTIPGVRG